MSLTSVLYRETDGVLGHPSSLSLIRKTSAIFLEALPTNLPEDLVSLNVGVHRHRLTWTARWPDGTAFSDEVCSRNRGFTHLPVWPA